MSNDLLDELDAKKTGKKPVMESGFAKQNRRAAAKATGKKDGTWAGEYYRRSFPIHPDTLEEMATWSGKLGISQNDLVRWFIDHGLDALKKGERPAIEDVVVRRRIAKR